MMKKNEGSDRKPLRREEYAAGGNLMVQMLGGFSMSYDGKEITFGKNRISKSMQLLQLMLYNKKGISRSKVVDILYGRGGLSDPSNNLRVTVYRLRKILEESELPPGEYFTTENAMFRWSDSIPLCVDVLEFQRLIDQASEETQKERRIAVLECVLSWYRGDFLPKLSGEDWVILETVHYKKEYEDALEEVLEYYRETKRYRDMLRLAAEASSIYPFDEWQTYKIDALIGMGREKEAYKVYEETTRIFIEELDVHPSPEMEEHLRRLGSRFTNVPQAIKDIKGGLLQEKETENGAYYCSLPSFIDEYRLIRRMGERIDKSVYLMLCTLTDGKGNPLESGDKLTKMSEHFKNAIKVSLRKGDTYTQYSTNQFLILLLGTNEENSRIIADRITRTFSAEHKYWKNCVDYYVTSAIDSEDEGTNISVGR